MSGVSRRRVFYPLLLAAIAAAALWTLRVPDRSSEVARCIPLGATVVSYHRGLAPRWRSLTALSLWREVAAEYGMEAAAWDALRTSPDLQRWLDTLAPAETAFAVAPRPGGRRAMYGVSWIGARGHRLRWLLEMSRSRDLAPIGFHGGRKLWQLATPGLDPAVRLVFAEEQGLLFVCLSEDARDMYALLDTYDGLRPASGDPAELRARPEFDGVVARLEPPWISALSPWRGRYDAALEKLDAHGLSLCVATPGRDFDLVVPEEPADLRGLAAVVGNLPEAVAVADRFLLARLLTNAFQRPWVRELWQLSESQTRGPWVGLLFGKPYLGRFMGAHVPALALAVRLRNPAAFAAALDASFDRLNAAYRLGLIAGAEPVAGGALHVLECASGDFVYSGLPPAERAAFAVRGEWLLVASNADTLRGVLERNPADDPAPPAWSADADLASGPLGAWLHLPRACRTLRLGLSWYSLELLAKRGMESDPLRRKIFQAKLWLDALAAMHDARLLVAPAAAGARVRLDLRQGAKK